MTRLLLIFLFSAHFVVFGQYFSNPSFEGVFPNPNNPPAGWEKCSGSPDTQPYTWDVTHPPSDGDSYVGFAWLVSWIERIWTPLSTPFSADSCYHIKIDLAFYPVINYYGMIQPTYPINIRFNASPGYCMEGTSLWQSPLISSENWQTFEFNLEPESDIENILLRSFCSEQGFGDIGYLLIDNIQVITPPPLDLGNDTILCINDSLVLNAGSLFTSYLWQDNSTDSVFVVYEPGVYTVEVTSEYGCVVTDSIVVDYMGGIELGNDTTICIGDTITFNIGAGYDEYLWYDGSTDSTLSVWEPGEYWIWVNVSVGAGCSDIDSLFLVIEDFGTEVSLGNDTTLCYGEEMTIEPGSFGNYLWQDGTTDSVYLVTQPGLYWLQVIGDCGTATDSIYVDYYPPVNVDIGSDTTICFSDNLQFDAGSGYISYLWQDGTTSQYMTVYESGSYSVSVVDYFGCEGSDEVFVTIEPEVKLPNDTSICEGDTIIINLNDDFDFITWNNGSSGNSLSVFAGGIYRVDVDFNIGCPSSDTIIVSETKMPVAEISGGTEICEGDTLLLQTISGDYDYFWNGEQGSSYLIVNSGGMYILEVLNSCGMAYDTVNVAEYPVPEVWLGEDMLIFPGQSVQLDAGNDGNVTYTWQDGSSDRYFTVEFSKAIENSIFYVDVFNGHCENSDTIRVEPFNVGVPSVITPNGDGYNDRFVPKDGWYGITGNKMTIYNRWGGKVWETNDFPSGWDGKQNGNYVADGTYFWVLEITYGPENLKQVLKGSVTVLGAGK